MASPPLRPISRKKLGPYLAFRPLPRAPVSSRFGGTRLLPQLGQNLNAIVVAWPQLGQVTTLLDKGRGAVVKVTFFRLAFTACLRAAYAATMNPGDPVPPEDRPRANLRAALTRALNDGLSRDEIRQIVEGR